MGVFCGASTIIFPTEPVAQKFETRRIRIPAKGPKKFDPTQLARVDLLLGARVARIKTAHKSKLNRNSCLTDQVDDSGCLRQIECDRLFGECGFSGFGGDLQQPGVGIRWVTITTASTEGLFIALSTSVVA